MYKSDRNLSSSKKIRDVEEYIGQNHHLSKKWTLFMSKS